MTEKKSKVLVAAYSRQFEGNYGTMYVHQVTFENQDTGEYLSKSQNQDKFVVGQEASYTIDNSNPAYPAKIKPVQENTGGGGFGKSDPAKNKSIERQTSLKAAVEVAPLFGAKTINDVLMVASKFHEWLQDKPQPEAEAPAEKNENDLPF